MSITSAMFAGTAGLRANSSALAAISDNIANVNTIGYKRTRNDFVALLTNQTQKTTYSAGGVLNVHHMMMAEQGAPIASSTPTHLAVSGDGFFVVRGRSDDATSADPYLFTRAGQFTPDYEGYLRNASGYYLQGWPARADGTFIDNPTDLTALVPIQVSGIPGDARATENIGIAANLNSSVPINAEVTATTYDPLDNTHNMAGGVVTPDYAIPMQVYDSLGGQHTVTFAFLRQGANLWNAEVYLDGTPNTLLSSGQMQFTATGQYDSASANSTMPTTLAVNAAGGAAPAWPATLGAAALSITLDFGGGSNGGSITSFDSPSLLSTSQIDGTPFGSLEAMDISNEGIVTAVFTNGVTRPIFKVPLATFPNFDGLRPEAGGVFRIAAEAGPLAMRNASTAGAGEIKSGALESSTVDLAEEFSNLIITQRAYSASSKIITTADEMLDELIRLKR